MFKFLSTKLLYRVHGFLTRYFSNNQKYRNIILVLFLIFYFLFSGISTVSAGHKFKVLVLHSYHHEFEWTSQIMAGIRSVLDESNDVELLIEHMDTKLHKPEILFPHLREIYAVKYHKIQPDIIISSDNNALNFLLSNRDQLFSGVPVVFCGINNYSDSLIKNQINMTGVAEHFDIEGTINLVLHLHPETRKIAVVSDTTHTSLINLERMKHSFPKFTDRVSFAELTGLAAQELKAALNRLPNDSLVIHNGLYRDPKGRNFTLEEGLDFVVQNTRAPVYTLWQFMIDQGVMGGVVVSGFSQGEQAALMAEKILQGESPGHIPVLKESPNMPIFDYTVMSRFGINRSALPEDSIVLNIPSSIYTDHKNLVWMAIVSTAFLSFIIFVLTFNITARKRVEDKLKKYQGHLEDLVKKRTAELEKDIIVRKRVENKLRKSDETLRLSMEASADGLWDWNLKTDEIYYSPAWLKILDTIDVVATYDYWKNKIHPDDKQIVQLTLEDHLKGKTEYWQCEHRLRIKKGEWKWVLGRGSVVARDINDLPLRMVGTMTDISERKLTEKNLNESEERYHALADASFEAVFITEKGYCVDSNLTGLKMFGYSHNDLIGRFGTDVIAPESKEIVLQNMLSNYEKPYEVIAQKKNGTQFYAEIRGRMIKYKNREMRVTVMHDIDKSKKGEEQIKASLKEKEVLLKEIHHRVKNNMQVISSLLKLQAANIRDERLTEALMDCRGRVQAMAFVHETLYSSDRLVAINFKTYISKLAGRMIQSHSINGRVKLTVNAEDISLGIDQATPLGLIINELVSNSLKYAFPENQQSEISIKFQVIAQNMSKLIFQDNGIGIPKDIDWRNTNSLGLQLVVLLAENQLDGTIDLNRNGGTRFTIKFRRKEIE